MLQLIIDVGIEAKLMRAAKLNQRGGGTRIMSNMDDLRSEVTGPEYETHFGVTEVSPVSEGLIFGLTAGQRMIISVILFLVAAVLGVAVLFATGTIVLPR
jgi:hypothetical protein